MALVRCPDCTRDVSDDARNCPHCGRRIRTLISGGMMLALVGLVMAAVFVYLLWKRSL